ncbi:YfcE family phosphodiesterase [Candidatus Pyrohabitans sp.]
MLVGILSDTHVYDRAQKLNPRVVETFRRRGVELILHAGDLTSRDVLEELSRVARVVAVQGNMDACYGTSLPEREVLTLGKHRVLLFHGRGIYPRGDASKLAYLAKEHRCGVIITGHTHAPALLEVGGVMIINPGSPTTPRRSLPSVAIAEFGEELEVEVVRV